MKNRIFNQFLSIKVTIIKAIVHIKINKILLQRLKLMIFLIIKSDIIINLVLI